MIDHHVGVSEVERYIIKKLDTDYFEEHKKFEVDFRCLSNKRSLMDQELAEKAKSIHVPHELKGPWTLFQRAIEVGWIDHEDLMEIIACLKQDDFGGYVREEFLIEPRWGLENALNLGFLDETEVCSYQSLVQVFEALSDSLIHHEIQGTRHE